MTRALSIAPLVLLLAACGASTGDLGSLHTVPPTAEPSIDAPSAEPTPGATPGASSGPGGSPVASPAPTGAGSTTVRAYFILGSFVDNAGLVPVLRDVPKTQAVGAAAMRELLAGPNDDELGARPAMYTTIPQATRFLGLTIDGGVATVNLSREFGSGGGSASVAARFAQVVYTLTQFPSIDTVQFQLDGAPAPAFGSDGSTFDRPVGRDDYVDQLPAIFVDRPAWGGAVAGSARIAGVANVFEATFRVEILDGAGRSLGAGPVTATCGSGCWGTFDVTISYHVHAAGWGTLRVFEPSAKDGSMTNVTDYPVWLAP